MAIAEYLETYANFLSGNYKYRHVRDTEWAAKFIQKGRKIVLGYSRYLSYGFFIAVGFALGIFAGVSFVEILQTEFSALDIALSWAIVGGISIPFIIAGILLWRPKFFYILGPEGIVYKQKKSKEIQLARWRDIIEIATANVKYRMKTSTITVLEIKIHLVDGRMLELDTLSLNLKEFPRAPREITTQELRDLVAFVFQRYYECYKNK